MSGDRAAVGPWKVCYSVRSEGGGIREMPPVRNVVTLGAALDHAARLAELGYVVRRPVLDTCG